VAAQPTPAKPLRITGLGVRIQSIASSAVHGGFGEHAGGGDPDVLADGFFWIWKRRLMIGGLLFDRESWIDTVLAMCRRIIVAPG